MWIGPVVHNRELFGNRVEITRLDSGNTPEFERFFDGIKFALYR